MLFDSCERLFIRLRTKNGRKFALKIQWWKIIRKICQSIEKTGKLHR